MRQTGRTNSRLRAPHLKKKKNSAASILCLIRAEISLLYEKPSPNPVIQDRKGCMVITDWPCQNTIQRTPPIISTWTPTWLEPTHTSRLPAFLWPFYLASLNRRFIRTGFGPVEPWPTSTCPLTSLSMLVATPCCPWTLGRNWHTCTCTLT